MFSEQCDAAIAITCQGKQKYTLLCTGPFSMLLDRDFSLKGSLVVQVYEKRAVLERWGYETSGLKKEDLVNRMFAAIQEEDSR